MSAQRPVAPPNPAMMGPPGMNNAPWMGPAYVASTFFVYESDIGTGNNITSLASLTSAQLTFNIAGDSDFFWTKFASFAIYNNAATTRSADQLPAVTALIINTTTGRQYSTAPVPLANYSGNGQFPFILPCITMWQAKSTIQVNLFNEGNITYTNLQLSFIGVKAFSAS